MDKFLDPAILFFIFGVFAGFVRSNLEIPTPISRFLSLYLLMALGLKGGFALERSGFTPEILLTLGLAVVLAIVIPLLGYALLRRYLTTLDAAAVAATYGSVSAVTFITATQSLDHFGISYGGHMAAAMALMESPAIILAIVLANRARAAQSDHPLPTPISKVLHESFTDGAQLLLLGSMAVGYFSGAGGQALMAPFSIDLFKGMLRFSSGYGADGRTQYGRPQRSLSDDGAVRHPGPGGARHDCVGMRSVTGSCPGRHHLADGVGRKRLLHCRSRGAAPLPAGSESRLVHEHVPGDYLPAQHHPGHSALHGNGRLGISLDQSGIALEPQGNLSQTPYTNADEGE